MLKILTFFLIGLQSFIFKPQIQKALKMAKISLEWQQYLTWINMRFFILPYPILHEYSYILLYEY